MISPGMHLLNLKNILVATELDDPGFGAVRSAAELAAASGASLHMVSVVGASTREESDAPARAALAAILQRAGGHPQDAAIHVLRGDPTRTINSLADRVAANVIVLGRHRAKASDTRNIGGTALAVVTNASCPCLVASDTLHLPLHQVLVPVDLSDTARGALLVGLSWASALRASFAVADRRDVTLTALHVASGPSAGTPSTPPTLERELAFLQRVGGSWADVTIRGETIVNPNPTQGIAAYVNDHAPDLVVMGTRGLGLDPIGRLGSTSGGVGNTIQAPLLLVPPAVWIAHSEQQRS